MQKPRRGGEEEEGRVVQRRQTDRDRPRQTDRLAFAFIAFFHTLRSPWEWEAGQLLWKSEPLCGSAGEVGSVMI